MKKILVVIALVSLMACGDRKQPNVEPVQNMMEQPSIKAQDHSGDRADQRANRLPPANTVAIGHPPYKYKGNPQAAGRELKNPVRVTQESLGRGKLMYDTYCLVCHGPKGKGDGTVAPKMLVPPPSVLTDKVRAWSDGSIYHVITDGQGMMGSYASQILIEDRWKIVNYIRQLQKENKE